MPTVLKEKEFRFFFFENDREETPHIHVELDNKYAIFWLRPLELEKSIGYTAGEINEIKNLLKVNMAAAMEKWNEYFTSQD